MDRYQRFNIECDEADAIQREAELEMPHGYLEFWPVPRVFSVGIRDLEGYLDPPSKRGAATPRTEAQKRSHFAMCKGG